MADDTPESLEDLYTDELKDLWSASDQMARAVEQLLGHATHEKLRTFLEDSQAGLQGHAELMKTLLAGHDEEVAKEHCKGMEGLCEEALKHTVEEGPEPGPVLDAAIIAQYQRMAHYGIAGFGTAAAYAEALEFSEDEEALEAATKDMYEVDELMTELAEGAVNRDAANED